MTQEEFILFAEGLLLGIALCLIGFAIDYVRKNI